MKLQAPSRERPHKSSQERAEPRRRCVVNGEKVEGGERQGEVWGVFEGFE